MEWKLRRTAFAVSFRNGSPGRTRTYDPAVNSRLLYQLSYRGSAAWLLADDRAGGKTRQRFRRPLSSLPRRLRIPT